MASRVLLFLLVSYLLLVGATVKAIRQTPIDHQEKENVETVNTALKAIEAEDQASNKAHSQEDDHQAADVDHNYKTSQASGTPKMNDAACVQGSILSDVTGILNGLGNFLSAFIPFISHMGKNGFGNGVGTANLNPETNVIPTNAMPTTKNK